MRALPPPHCQIIAPTKVFSNVFLEQCPDPSESTNAIVKGKNFYHGKKVEFACTKDEVLTPEISRRLTCEYGTWKGVIPSCKGRRKLVLESTFAKRRLNRV